MEKKITRIESRIAKLQKFTSTVRVAAYARVSTNKAEQEMSLEAQIDYFQKYVQNHVGWELVEVFHDDGVTGTSYRRREGFKRMIAECEAGKIDRIVTKSISRFARNTVDTIKTIRQLKAQGIGIYFQKEDIWTLDGKSEFILTLMASFAQEESRSISDNVAWGQRKRFADGYYWLGYSSFLGYDKDFVINEEEAKTVRRIYRRCIQGISIHGIGVELTRDEVLTPMKSENWSVSTVKSILHNVKYKGDALTQIGYTESFLTKKYVKNTGQLPQYYVTGGHDPIISPEIFDYVQEIMEDRDKIDGMYSGRTLLNSKFRCGKCGATFGPKPIHSNDKYRHNILQCRNRFRKGNQCRNRHFYEAEIDSVIRFILLEILKRQTGLKEQLNVAISEVVPDENRLAEIRKEIRKFQNSEPEIDMEEFAWIVEKIIVIDEDLTVEVFGGLNYKVKWPIQKIRKKREAPCSRRKKNTDETVN